jgi:hypothetical protein
MWIAVQVAVCPEEGVASAGAAAGPGPEAGIIRPGVAEAFGRFLDLRGLPRLWGLGVEVPGESAVAAGVGVATATGFVAEARFPKPVKTFGGLWG